MTEIWKDIADYEGLYQISNMGNVRSLDRLVFGRNGFKLRKGKILSKSKIYGKGISNPYLYVTFTDRCKRKTFQVHRLVAQEFLPNIKNLPQVNHKDWNPSNNCVSNLEWCTALYNNTHKKPKSEL